MPNPAEISHNYGPRVHILNNPYLSGLLAKLCSAETQQPLINHLVQILYQQMLSNVMNAEFPINPVHTETRMTPSHPEILLHTEQVSNSQRTIVVNLARAGTYPSHVCFEHLHYAIQAEQLRQDHIFASRLVHSDGKVKETDIGSSKIGGDKDKAMILIPDPMGATGHTIVTALRHYQNFVPGNASKVIALHLIITPEYLRNVLQADPDILVYAIRLDRGLSSQAVLNSIPGTFWNEERGLNDHDYIVPGGGGFGEIMNNSFV
jgi:uracil phosphoribosyltransferase